MGVSEMEALSIAEDVRRRDEERLAMQSSGGMYAGNSTLTTTPVTPEPLIKPTRESRRLDKATAAERDEQPEPAIT